MKILYSIRAVFICSIVTGNIKIVLVFLLLFFYGVATLLAKDGDNVILIVIDSLQSSHLRCYGYNKETSPNIDSLAKQGTMFKGAIAQSSWTCSSMPSILTGTYPRTHRRYDWNHLVNPDKKTIMDVLRENG